MVLSILNSHLLGVTKNNDNDDIVVIEKNDKKSVPDAKLKVSKIFIHNTSSHSLNLQSINSVKRYVKNLMYSIFAIN